MTDLQASYTQSNEMLKGLSLEDQEILLRRLRLEQTKREKANRLAYYRPYPKQAEFHRAGAPPVHQRLFMAGNQLGKTVAGAAETAMHLTGRYPRDWEGLRFDKPIVAYVGSESSELTRDGVQRLLMGSPGIDDEKGTGFIPRDSIDATASRAGVPGAIDNVAVLRDGGGVSQVFFKSYDQGRGKWQANTVDWVWFDEEPPLDVFSEGVTRTNATGGCVIVTFTPLMGMSEVVKRFLNEPSKFRKVVTMTIHDVTHITASDRERIISETPEHEREARTMGVPMLGSGSIFPVTDSAIMTDPVKIMPWFRRLGAMDFGYDHPFGAVEIAYDGDADVIYITREFRVRNKTPADHATALRPWGPIRWAWPHDGLAHDKGSGGQLRDQYKKHGLLMLAENAKFDDGSVSVEAGLFQMLERMMSGRWKVFATCQQWMEEKRMYHRKDGKIVKIDDDLLSASRYGTMMLRHARAVEPGSPFGFSRKGPPVVAEGTGTVIL